MRFLVVAAGLSQCQLSDITVFQVTLQSVTFVPFLLLADSTPSSYSLSQNT